MPAPLGILFCWKFIQYISALWHQVHGVSSLLVGEQGACALLSSPGRRDACRHLWESSLVKVRVALGKQACLQLDLIRPSMVHANGTIQSFHVCMCAGIQRCNCTQ